MKLDPSIQIINNSHIYAKDAKKIIEPNIWNTYKKICVVRNSWDWQMSLYFYSKNLKSHHQHNIIKDMNIKEYLLWRRDNDLHQQQEFILDDNEECLIDNIFKFENLTMELIVYFKQNYNLNVIPFLPSKKINTSSRDSDYTKYYNEETKNILLEMHKPDIDRYGFTF